MKYEKFKIINLVKDLIISIDRNLTNFPKKEIELKQEIKKTTYNLLYIVYEGNVTTNMSKRENLQENAIAKLKYLDFLINLCYDKLIINGKKYLKFGENIENIIRYIVAWKNANNTIQQGKVIGLASRYLNENSNNANFNVRYVNNNGNLNNYNLSNVNSNGNVNGNYNYFGVRPVASIN